MKFTTFAASAPMLVALGTDHGFALKMNQKTGKGGGSPAVNAKAGRLRDAYIQQYDIQNPGKYDAFLDDVRAARVEITRAKQRLQKALEQTYTFSLERTAAHIIGDFEA